MNKNVLKNKTDENFKIKLKEKYNFTLNQGQEKFVSVTDGYILFIAVPGAGKTFSLCVKLFNMITEHNINPKDILCITFSNASVKDMRNKFNTMFQSELEEQSIDGSVHFSTIHSFSFRIINYLGRLTNSKFILIDSEEAKANGIYKRKIFNDFYREICSESLTDDDEYARLLANISFVKNEQMSDLEIQSKGSEYHPHFYELYTKYEQFKKDNGYIDFDDMLIIALKALKENEQVKKIFSNSFKYVLVDEGQDTSSIQFEIINEITSVYHNLCMLGDDDQTIYEWRNADISNFLYFDKRFPDAKKIFTNQNFRSTKKIIRICNEFIKNNKVRFEKELCTENEEGENVEIIKCSEYIKQSEYIIEDLKGISEYKDVAIIYRNNTSSYVIANELFKHNIPFCIRGVNPSYFNHWVIQDIKNFFKFALDFKNVQAFCSIAFKMNRYISAAMKNTILKYSSMPEYKDYDVFDILLNIPELKSYQKNTIKVLKQEFLSLRKKTVPAAIKYILDDFDYTGTLERLKEDNNNNSIEYLKEIISTIKELTKDCIDIKDFENTLSNFVETLKDSVNNYGENAITLITAHSSKGLEWNNVYMIDMINGIFPSYKSISESKNGDKSLEEAERRVAYVGMSRAKKKLKLLYCCQRNGEKTEPSNFIKEIKNLTVSKQDLTLSTFPVGFKEEDENLNVKAKSSSISKKKTKKSSKSISSEQLSLLDNKVTLTISKETTSQNKTNQKKEIRVGENIVHKNFGEGVIKKLNDKTKIAEVLFLKSNEVKKINLEICEKRALLL